MRAGRVMLRVGQKARVAHSKWPRSTGDLSWWPKTRWGLPPSQVLPRRRKYLLLVEISRAQDTGHGLYPQWTCTGQSAQVTSDSFSFTFNKLERAINIKLTPPK